MGSLGHENKMVHFYFSKLKSGSRPLSFSLCSRHISHSAILKEKQLAALEKSATLVVLFLQFVPPELQRLGGALAFQLDKGGRQRRRRASSAACNRSRLANQRKIYGAKIFKLLNI